MSVRAILTWCSHSCLSYAIWLGLVEWELAEMRWPRWLYSLTDPLDRWCADDKLSHLFGGLAAMCLTHSWFALVAAVLLVEAVEYWRWEKWQAKGAPLPWPWLTDRVSLKDIAWGLLGAWIATW